MSIRFGLALDFRSAVRTLDEQLARYIELIRLGERYGFESVTAGETYAARPGGGGHLPSPFLALAALAPQTRMKVGTGVTLLPAWHPLRLAYDAAVLDQLSGGRLILGVGLGTPPLYRRFGLDPERMADYADDTLAMLRALWTGENGFQGKYVSVEGGVGISPIQHGGPAIWVGGSRRRSVERAAEWGDGYIASSNYPLDTVARQSGRYRAALRARGKDSSAAVVVANRLTLVAESEAEAREAARAYVGAVLQSYARAGALGDDLRTASAPPGELFEAFDTDHCLVGTPDQVIARIRQYTDAGVTHIQARVSPADIPLEIAARSVELLGKAVLPALQ